MESSIQNTRPYYRNLIPNDWDIETLQNCSLIKGEYGINAAAVNYSKSLPAYLRITDINEDGNYSHTKKSSVNDLNSENFVLEEGDIVFARTGATVGKTYLYNKSDGKLVFAGFLIRFRPDKKKLNVNFLKHLTNSKTYWDWVKVYSVRGGQPGINAKEFGSFKLPLPAIGEQESIAKILDSMDKAININNQNIFQKELRIKWLMKNLLTGKKRLKGFTGEWKKQPISNYIQQVVREIDKPNTPYLGIGIRSHGKGTFLKPNENPKSNVMTKFYVVRPNDLIVNITFAWEQAIAIVKPKDDGALASHRFPIYEFIEGKGHVDFFRFLIVQPRMKYLLGLISPGGAGRNRVMSRKDFIKLEITAPVYEEQKAIAQTLMAADKEIKLLNAKTDMLKEQKKGMMQVLLTGKKRLKLN